MFNPREYPPIERNPDRSLICMTQRQHWDAKRIIRDHCCNCIDDHCLLLDNGDEVICPQLLSRSVCCTYFRHVLPKDKDNTTLEAELFGNADVRHCALCGKPYIAHSNNAKYCDECKVIAKKKQQAEYAKRARAKRRKVEL